MRMPEIIVKNIDRRKNSQIHRLKSGLGVGAPLAIVMGILDKKMGWGLESYEVAALAAIITTGAVCTGEKLERVCVALYSLSVMFLRRRKK